MSGTIDFSSYDENLNLEQLYKEGKDALLVELKKTRELYYNLGLIIEDSIDGFFITDGTGVVIKMNKSYEYMAGVKREDLLGKKIRDLEHITISKSASLIVIKNRKPVTIEQEYLNTKRTAYITSNPIFDENGNIIMIVSNNRDFKEIDKLKNQLEASQRLASKFEDKIKAITNQLINQYPIITNDEKMYEVVYKAEKVAKTDATVLILGETGTGKEEIAKLIHHASNRKSKPFIKINCSAISKQLVESELFGYEKGAFTGASNGGKLGYFEIADEGTLFLDEIGEMPFELQAKILRVLQDGEFIRVGGNKPIKIDVRVITATNRNLIEMVKNNQFREDLYYRLNIVQIYIPSLRERKNDIIPLTDFFLKQYNEKFKSQRSLSQYSYNILKNYKWPGNVRELKNTIEQIVIMSDSDIISSEDLLKIKPFLLDSEIDDSKTLDLKKVLEQIEYEYIKKYYADLGTLKLTAQKLGVNLKTLSRRKAYLENKLEMSN